MRLLTCLLSFLAAGPALAWDATLLEDVRFSPDGRHFSFVEYGGSIESEFAAHAAMFVIDTRQGRWVRNTPIRVEIPYQAEGWDEAALRAVREKGREFVTRYDLRSAPEPLVEFEDVDRGGPHERRREVALSGLGSARLELRERRATAAHFCTEDHPVARDFSLVLTDEAGPIEIADYQGKLPRSRGCPDGYDIAAVYLHETAEASVLAVIVGVYTPGWEGSDRGLIAVTRQLPRNPR